jgi:protein ECT2
VGSKFSFSQQSSSSSATSVTDEDSFGPRSRSPSAQKLLKRGRSPDQNVSPPKSRYSSYERSGLERDTEPWGNTAGSTELDESEWDLSMRLELARQNSLSQQHTGDMTTQRTELSLQETIAEGVPRL